MDRILVCCPNWLGDGIMSMPAVQSFKRGNPDVSISVLVKRSMVPLWRMCHGVDDVLELESGFIGSIRTAENINRCGFKAAYIFPNSFRSALIPFLAGIPVRRGVAGHYRKFLLNDICVTDFPGMHQSREYYSLMGLSGAECVITPHRLIEAGDAATVSKKHLGDFEAEKKIVALIPGAAYGLAKMWPAEYFVSVARRLVEEHACRILVMGTDSEIDICMLISEELGESAVCLAGETTLAESVVLLRDCDFVISNDSGGMHLAAAVGTPVVAVYGITDPAKTGPLGEGHRIIAAEGVRHDRDLDRDSEDAIAAMRSIEPDRVYRAALELLK